MSSCGKNPLGLFAVQWTRYREAVSARTPAQGRQRVYTDALLIVKQTVFSLHIPVHVQTAAALSGTRTEGGLLPLISATPLRSACSPSDSEKRYVRGSHFKGPRDKAREEPVTQLCLQSSLPRVLRRNSAPCSCLAVSINNRDVDVKGSSSVLTSRVAAARGTTQHPIHCAQRLPSSHV